MKEAKAAAKGATAESCGSQMSLQEEGEGKTEEEEKKQGE